MGFQIRFDPPVPDAPVGARLPDHLRHVPDMHALLDELYDFQKKANGSEILNLNWI